LNTYMKTSNVNT